MLSTCALSSAATYQFPYNNGGTLNTLSFIRQQLTSTNFDEIDSGLTHSVARQGFTVYTWGKDNALNQLGRSGDPATPQAITQWHDALGFLLGPPEIQKVVAGDNFCMALEANDGFLNLGRVFIWGHLPGGIDIAEPTDITGVITGLLSSNVDIAAGGNHGLILYRSLLGFYHLYAFGENGSGQCGVSSATNPVYPAVDITHNFGSGNPLNNSQVVSMSAGHAFSSLVRANGKVYSWGDNTDGELGDGTNVSNFMPQTGLAASGNVLDATEVSCGYDFVVLRRGATVSTAGHKILGTLGRSGGNANRFIDIGLAGVTKISAGYRYSLALSSLGLYQWGFMVQTKDSGATFNTPTLLPGFSNVNVIHAGNRVYDTAGPFGNEFLNNGGGLTAVQADGVAPMIYKTRLYTDASGSVEAGQKYVGGATGMLRVFVDQVASGGNGPTVTATVVSPSLTFTTSGGQVPDGSDHVDIMLQTYPVDSSTVVHFNPTQDGSYTIDRKLTVLRPRAAGISVENLSHPGQNLKPGDTVRIGITLQQPASGNGYTFSYWSSNHRIIPTGSIVVGGSETTGYNDIVLPSYKQPMTLTLTVNNGNSAANVRLNIDLSK